MKNFEYSDQEIGTKEMAIAISSMIIGVGILNLPRLIAKATSSSDGWISILIAGGIAIRLAWILAKFAIMIHKQGFFLFTANVTAKPIAFIATSAIAIYFIMFSAYEVRAIANISKQYLFERTPVEFIALTFILVVIYAVSGHSVSLLQLNVLFLPLVLVIAVFVLIFSSTIFRFEELRPFIISDWKQIGEGVKESIFSMLGFEIVLFYTLFMNRPHEATKAAIIGVTIPVLLYLVIYIICVGVFTQAGLREITYPSIELAKEIKIPGEFFERFESIFFTIWIMTIVNTTTMALDISVHILSSMIQRMKRMNWLFILAPCVYIISMFPRNEIEFSKFGTLISYTGLAAAVFVPILLYFIAKLRGVKRNAS